MAILVAGENPQQRYPRQRRSYEPDPKGAATALVRRAIINVVVRRPNYARVEAMLAEINALPPERLTPGDRERVASVRALTQGDLRAMLAAALRLHAWAPDDKTWHDQVLHGLTVTLLRRGSASATMPGGSGAGRRRHSPLGWMDSIGPPQSCSTRTSSRWRPIPHSRSPRAETVGRRNEQGRVDFSSPTNVGNILITDHTDEYGSIRAARIRSVMIHVIRGWIEWECSEGGRKPALLRHYDKLPRKYPKRVLD